MPTISSTKLDQALALAEEGFYVFRLIPNGKIPFARGWQNEATRDEDEIQQLFDNGGNARDFNIGIYTAKYFQFSGNNEFDRALAVVDVDTKEGKQGNDTIRGLEALGFELTPTRTVTTASGGRHHIYIVDSPLQGGANKLGLHVDLKSSGGYIVAEGSTINNIPYRRDTQSPSTLDNCPQWIIDKAGHPLDKSAFHQPQAIEATDTPQAIQRASYFLTHVAEEAIQGAGGNSITYKAAAECRDIGLSEPTTLNLMASIYNKRCQPAWYFDELEILVANVYKYAKLPLGANSPHNGAFTAIPDEPTAAGKKEFYFKYPDAIKPDFDYYPLVEDYLDQSAVSILYGESNAGKTFVALDLAFHIATGKPWNQKRTSQGNTLYIAAEGGKSAENRILALKQHYDTKDFPLALMPCAINLFDSPEHIKQLMEIIHTAQQQRGPLKLIVIDTLSRALFGGNENDSQDMGVFVANLTSLRNAANAHILVVHHSGKDKARGARGHSLLRAAVDTEIEVADNIISVTKQRDMAFNPPIGFELNIIPLGTTPYGKTIDSCTITLVEPSLANAKRDNRLDERDLIALLALEKCKTGRELKGFENVIDQKDWAQCCKDFDFTIVPRAVPWPKSRNSFNVAFERVRERLVTFDRVVEIEQNQWAIQKR